MAFSIIQQKSQNQKIVTKNMQVWMMPKGVKIKCEVILPYKWKCGSKLLTLKFPNSFFI